MTRLARKQAVVCDGCGWTGQRAIETYAPVEFTYTSGRREIKPRWLPLDPIAKRCPRCGGQVELIVAGPSPIGGSP